LAELADASFHRPFRALRAERVHLGDRFVKETRGSPQVSPREGRAPTLGFSQGPFGTLTVALAVVALPDASVARNASEVIRSRAAAQNRVRRRA
jgi:hypothetical protein